MSSIKPILVMLSAQFAFALHKNMFMILLTVLVLVLTTLLYLVTSKRNYWKKKKVPYVEPTPILGNYGDYILLKEYMGIVAQRICQKFPNEPYIGAFYGTEPTLMVQDPEVIKTIMTKDFYYFSSREISKYTHNEVMTQNLFFTYGDRWKVIRQNLTPLFSSAKMKNMFYLIEKCAHTFEDLLDYETSSTNVIDTKSLTARFTIDSICSCAFGIDTKTMEENPKNNTFTIIGEKVLESSTSRGIKWISRAIWPGIFYGLGLKNFPKEVDSFFRKLLMEVFQSRQFKPSSKNDFIDLVLQLKQNKCIVGDSITNAKTGGNEKVHLEVDDELLLAQCIVFFAAGYETSATTQTYTLYELAKNNDVQKRVQEEIDGYLRARDNKLQYDCITDLPYTAACMDETLRLYPVLGVLTREVVEDYTFPNGLTLDKDSRVHIPVYHLHHNPDYFPDPGRFNPERFYGEARRNIKPYTYMPFGEGPRICIGMRFAKMEVMSGLVSVLKKYTVELADDMPRTLKFDPRSIVTQPIGGINLKFTPREGWQERIFKKD